MPTMTSDEFARDPRAVMTRAERDDVTITDGNGTPIMVLMTQREALPNPERDAERERWRAAVRALLDAMPKCSFCGKVATRAYIRGGEWFCDGHIRAGKEHPPEDPHAAPLRALQAMVEEEESGK